MRITADASSDAGAGPHSLFARVAARYGECGRGVRLYVGGKLRHDPVHGDALRLAAAEPFGDVVDAGCGRGQLAIALLEAGLASSVVGIDRSAKYLAQASRAAAGLRFSGVVQDFARDQTLPAAETVLLVDVLYQLHRAGQDALLAAAARAARRLVLIRTLDPELGLRSALTLGFEHVARLASPHSGEHVRPPPLARAISALRSAGFATSVSPCWRGTPFANVLLTARRTGQPATS